MFKTTAAILFSFALTSVTAQTTITLRDVTNRSGLEGLLNYRITIADFNGDGKPDMLSLYGNETSVKMRLFYNTFGQPGKKFFTEDTSFALISARSWAEIACVTDIDRDGDADILVAGNYNKRLIANSDSCE